MPNAPVNYELYFLREEEELLHMVGMAERLVRVCKDAGLEWLQHTGDCIHNDLLMRLEETRQQLRYINDDKKGPNPWI